MRFLIFRHGQTDWNKEWRIQGSSNTPLNDFGREQAKGLIPIMEELKPEIIYSSDLDRAFDTGKTVSDSLGIEIIAEKRLREANFGQAEGMTVDEIKKRFGESLWNDFRKLNSQNKKACFPGGETRFDSVLRMRSVIDEIVSEQKYKTVGISTHGGVVRNLLHSYLPDDHEPIAIPNCVVYLLELEMNKFKVSGPIERGHSLK